MTAEPESRHTVRILEDIDLALELHGVVQWQYLNDIPDSLLQSEKMQVALGQFAKLHDKLEKQHQDAGNDAVK